MHNQLVPSLVRFVVIISLLLGGTAVGAATGDHAALESQLVARVLDSGQPADGVFDIELRRFDSETSRDVLDSTRMFGVEVAAGHLQLTLPESWAQGESSWVEIAISDAGEEAFEALPIRQPIANGAAGAVCSVGTLEVTERVGVGLPNPSAALHLLTESEAPSALPANENGLLLGVENVGTSTRWIQSYGANLVLNPVGNRVGIATEAPEALLDVNGTARANLLMSDGVVSAAGGYQQPGSGGETLRIVRGQVQGTGTAFGGSGFSASRTGLGEYTITFDTDFGAVPTATASGFGAASVTATISLLDEDDIRIETYDAAGNQADRGFTFIVVGPAAFP